MTNPQEWLPTPAAAIALGCSQSHLKRSRDSHGGILEGGVDYCLGASTSAPITWHVERVRAKFHHHGQLLRAGDSVIREVQA